ncbi:discoidin domain-containing protein [Roseomonas populi]|uniref:Discoidin domain-containing protein n=1 Tax=Roseomonas populi TaxID=3121582 RepID=A0ABT1X125_9PROT|nr:discoidin domain-containing protein [Roseomonas pecuniae]MCR0981785.1 discoidin domain-containing protein [Roseomonas pecuniae]
MAVIAWRNAAEAAGVSLSSNTQAPGLGVQSLLTPTIAEVWRSATGGAVTHWIGIDFGAVVPLRLLAIAAPRDGILPGTGATWRVVLSNTSVGGTDVANPAFTALDMRRGVAATLLPAPVSARYAQFIIRTVAGDPYLQLGRVWAGEALVTSRAVSYGWGRGVLDAGTVERAPVSGVRYAQRGATYRRLDFDLQLLPPEDALALDEAGLALGTTAQGFVSPLNDDLRHGMFGRFSEPPAPEQSNHRLFKAHIAFQEDL